jgi:hypothetical protein
MKFILEYNSFSPKRYEVGDIVLIEYWYLDDESCDVRLHRELPFTPVKIVKKIGRSFLISHSIPESLLNGAPDEIIKGTDIIDFAR